LTATVSLIFLQVGISSFGNVDIMQASPMVAGDICKAFDIGKDGLFRTTTYRSK
jgi:hypothetical protein